MYISAESLHYDTSSISVRRRLGPLYPASRKDYILSEVRPLVLGPIEGRGPARGGGDSIRVAFCLNRDKTSLAESESRPGVPQSPQNPKTLPHSLRPNADGQAILFTLSRPCQILGESLNAPRHLKLGQTNLPAPASQRPHPFLP